MAVRDLLVEQLRATFDDDGWFVAIGTAIRGVSAEQASWKREGVDHSILETLTHLNFYNERHLRKLRGEAVSGGPERIADTYTTDTANVDGAWRKEKARFKRVMSGWLTLVEESQAARGVQQRRSRRGTSGAYEAPWVPVLTHLTLHNAYHCGQIVLTRKLQGSWNPAIGISK
ncbi:MAG: DinB family protein [Vicinamibacterales bacterium]